MKAIQTILVSLFLLVTIKISFAQPGTLDPTFGAGGEVNLHPYFADEQAEDIAVTTDGKILLLAKQNYLLRLKGDGTLDTTFGVQGKLNILQDDDYVYASAIEIDSANRILVFAEYDFFYIVGDYVYRLLPNGSTDTTFGEGGEILTGIKHGNRALFLQSDGKIVVGGAPENDYDPVANIERLTIDGSPDSSFNDNGMNVIPGFENSYVFAINQQSDGKLLATGHGDSSMFVARFNMNGQPDSSFDDDGLAIFSGNGIMAGQDVVETSDGNILVVGHRETAEESSLLCWKLLPNGTLDSSFGNNGIDTLYAGGENNFAWFVYANADSTAIVGGTIFDGEHYFPVLYRLRSNGSLDSSFGMNGMEGKTFTCGKSIQMNGVRTADGKILFCGTGFDNGNNYVSVSQLHPDGTIDSSFGNNDLVSLTTDSSDYNATSGECLVLNDGKILITGSANDYDLIFFRLSADGTIDSTYGHNGYYLPNQQLENSYGLIASDSSSIYFLQNALPYRLGVEDLAFPAVYSNAATILHKFHADGSPDSSFGVNGIINLRFSNFQSNGCTDLAIQTDGKLLVAGYETPSASYNYVFVERLNADGSIDSTFGNNGTKIFDEHNNEYHLYITVRSDNKINCAYIYPLNIQHYIAVSRLLPDGSFDSTFANNGSDSVWTVFWSLRQFMLQADNKMLILETADTSSILRLNEDGSIDGTFANAGILPTSGFGMQLQSDQKILTWDEVPLTSALINRYKNYGDVDLTFGDNGVATLTGEFSSGSPYSLRLQPDGKILFTNSNYPNFYVARLLNDIGLSVNEPVAFSTLKVYPNPVSDQLIVSNHFSSDELTTISINDIIGKKVWNEVGKFSGDYFTLSVQDLTPGIYMITVQTENNSETTKFVKQ